MLSCYRFDIQLNEKLNSVMKQFLMPKYLFEIIDDILPELFDALFLCHVMSNVK